MPIIVLYTPSWWYDRYPLAMALLDAWAPEELNHAE